MPPEKSSLALAIPLSPIASSVIGGSAFCVAS
jgi:hypothetical protein